MKKIFLVFILALFLSLTFISTHGEETFAEAESIIQQKISCDDITDEQLEILGDYYMEQMHPGELHEIMDERMGGEGSESLRQVHINMGLAFYCGEHDEFSGSMMNTMMGRNMMYGMMGNYYYNRNNPFIWIFNILLIVGLVLFIIWLVKEIRKNKKHRRR
ncbi:MAG: hypothetical protein ABIH49_01215 [archaeon]